MGRGAAGAIVTHLGWGDGTAVHLEGGSIAAQAVPDAPPATTAAACAAIATPPRCA